MLTVASSSLILHSSYLCYNVYNVYNVNNVNILLVYSCLMLLQFIVSTIYHYHNADEDSFKYGHLIKRIDVTTAKTIAFSILFLSIYYKFVTTIIYLIYVGAIYYFKLRDRPLQVYPHVSMHIVAYLGIRSFLYNYNQLILNNFRSTHWT